MADQQEDRICKLCSKPIDLTKGYRLEVGPKGTFWYHQNCPIGKTRQETIYMPYSFYSQKGYESIIDALHNMGYNVAKLYPDDKPLKQKSFPGIPYPCDKCEDEEYCLQEEIDYDQCPKIRAGDKVSFKNTSGAIVYEVKEVKDKDWIVIRIGTFHKDKFNKIHPQQTGTFETGECIECGKKATLKYYEKTNRYYCINCHPIDSKVGKAKAIALFAIDELRKNPNRKLDEPITCPYCKKPILMLPDIIDHFECFVKANPDERPETILEREARKEREAKKGK